VFTGHRSVSGAFDMSLLEIDPDHPQVQECRVSYETFNHIYYINEPLIYQRFYLRLNICSLPQDGLSLTLQVHVPKHIKHAENKAEMYISLPICTIGDLIQSNEVLNQIVLYLVSIYLCM